MKSNRKISVGLCTYNGEKYIEKQIKSIINQTISPDEIIICDDCSKDNTVNIIRETLKNCSIKYKIIINDTCLGLHGNFTKCFNECSGDIIFSCDQDDIWYKNKIESFLRTFNENADCELVYSNCVVINEDDNIILHDFWNIYGIEYSKLNNEEIFKVQLNNMCFAGCNMAFKKELWDRIKPIPFHYIHDSWLAICSSIHGIIKFLPEPLIMYRQHSSNTSNLIQISHLINQKIVYLNN